MRKVVSYVRKNFTLSEVSGSLGDLGTLLPLLLGLVQSVGLDLGTSLISTGIINIITGIQFGIPMPVQPMKTIAAEALSNSSITLEEVTPLRINVSKYRQVEITGDCCWALCQRHSAVSWCTGLMGIFNRIVPFSIVRGIQLGVGLQLASSGISMVFYETDGIWRQWGGSNGLALGLIALIFVLLTIVPKANLDHSQKNCEETANKRTGLFKYICERKAKDNEDTQELEDDSKNTSNIYLNMNQVERVGNAEVKQLVEAINEIEVKKEDCRMIPAALILVIIGIIITFIFDSSLLNTLSLGPSQINFIVPSLAEFKSGILKMGLPQLPLTTLNSVVAVSHLSEDLFPQHPAHAGTVAVSVGAMNLLTCWFGAMPACHGASGLAGQYRFGARTGLSPIFLGLVKIFLGVLFGSSLYLLMKAFPEVLLGAMLTFSGIELAASCKSVQRERDMALMLLIAAGKFATDDTGIGFAVGAASYCLLKIQDFYNCHWNKMNT